MNNDNTELLIITETGHIDTVLTEGQGIVGPGRLGRLSGPIADFKDSTRNKRFYSRKLWDRVFSTPWVQEAISTKTLFGEADHPADRISTLIKEAAVVMTSYSFDENNQCVRGEFDILDTPNGRILKSLADYGCRLGISSRGKGSIKTVNGRSVVDEDTYVFGGFDVVTLPAVQKARQDYFSESMDTNNNLSEAIKTQIAESESTQDLKVLKNILESTNLPESDKLLQSIDSRLSEIENFKSNTIVIEGLTKDLKEAYLKIDELTSKLDESVNTIDMSSDEEDVNESLVRDLTISNNELELKLEKLSLELKRKNTENSLSKRSYSELTNKLSESLSHSNKLLSDAKSDNDKSLSESLELNEEFTDLKRRYDSVNSNNAELNEELLSTINEYNELVNEFNSIQGEYELLMDNHISVTSGKLGISKESLISLLPENFTAYDVDSEYRRQSSLRSKLGKLPIINESVVSKPVNPQTSIKTNKQYDDTIRLLKAMRS